MKAFVYTQYGSPDVLQPKEVAKPTPKDNEVLIKVYSASLNAADKLMLAGTPFIARFDFGLFKPKNIILGADVAGRVEAVGKSVTQFKVGDEVFGDISGDGLGGFAQYVCATERCFVLKPASLSFDVASSVPLAAVTALQGLRKGNLKAGQKVLINGASGGVGTFALQIAKAMGAEVTAVCSTSKIEMVRSLGADHVIDYTKEDFTKNGQHYDLILGANGNRSIFEYKRSLAPKGAYVMVGGTMSQIFQALILGSLVSEKDGRTLSNLMAQPNQADLLFVTELITSGKVTPVIDPIYPFAEVPKAFAHLITGRAKGKLVISIQK